MKKGLTELVFVLDRSGSMGGLESDTIGGFNAMIEKQKREPGEAFVTTVLFDDQYEMIHNRFNIEMIRPLTANDYYARGYSASGCSRKNDRSGGADSEVPSGSGTCRKSDLCHYNGWFGKLQS